MTQPLYDPVWLERMYNNRALVPDHMSYLDRWAEASAQVRASQPCSLDVPYGDGEGERLDVFPASSARAGGVPVMVFIHGGYWRSLDKSDHSFVAPAFTRAGVCVSFSTTPCARDRPRRPSRFRTSCGRWKRLWPGWGAILPTMAAIPNALRRSGTLRAVCWRQCVAPDWRRPAR